MNTIRFRTVLAYCIHMNTFAGWLDRLYYLIDAGSQIGQPTDDDIDSSFWVVN